MTLQQLRYFKEMADTLHYTQAAKKLNISQPSLSYALQELSKELGVTLFETTGKKTALTTDAQTFLPYVESALNILNQGRQHLHNLHISHSGSINLGYIYTVSFDIIPHIIDDFSGARKHLKTNFNFQVSKTNTLIEKLLNGSLDIVIAPASNPIDSSIEVLPIIQQELYLLVHKSHHLSSKAHVDIDDFKDEPFIMIQKDTDLYTRTEQFFKDSKVIPKIAYTVDECNSMAAFVSSNLGVGIMPKIPSLNDYNTVVIPFKGKGFKRSINLLFHKEGLSNSAAKDFIEHCKKYSNSL